MARIRDIFDRERPGEQILHPVGKFLAKGDVMLAPDDQRRGADFAREPVVTRGYPEKVTPPQRAIIVDCGRGGVWIFEGVAEMREVIVENASLLSAVERIIRATSAARAS
jgi:hypothetical protein